MFCKGIFKDALIRVAENVDRESRFKGLDAPLEMKINSLSRSQMLSGLNP